MASFQFDAVDLEFERTYRLAGGEREAADAAEVGTVEIAQM